MTPEATAAAFRTFLARHRLTHTAFAELVTALAGRKLHRTATHKWLTGATAVPPPALALMRMLDQPGGMAAARRAAYESGDVDEDERVA